MNNGNGNRYENEGLRTIFMQEYSGRFWGYDGENIKRTALQHRQGCPQFYTMIFCFGKICINFHC